MEKPVVDYLRRVLEKDGIATQTFAVEPNRPNLVARLKGNGKKRPLLLMAHTDTVNIDAKKWTHPPFSALRQDGYIYGRGTVDDKDNVAATVMALLTLKRQNVPLDRDVIALFEAGEEGAVRFGIAVHGSARAACRRSSRSSASPRVAASTGRAARSPSPRSRRSRRFPARSP